MQVSRRRRLNLRSSECRRQDRPRLPTSLRLARRLPLRRHEGRHWMQAMRLVQASGPTTNNVKPLSQSAPISKYHNPTRSPSISPTTGESIQYPTRLFKSTPLIDSSIHFFLVQSPWPAVLQPPSVSPTSISPPPTPMTRPFQKSPDSNHLGHRASTSRHSTSSLQLRQSENRPEWNSSGGGRPCNHESDRAGL